MKNHGKSIFCYQHKYHAGFILPTILIIIFVIMLMSLSNSVINQMLIKQNSGAIMSMHATDRIHVTLNKVEALVNDDTTCIEPITAANLLKKQSIAWWKEHACSLETDQQTYYYIIELLGLDDCGIINHSEAELMIANYYRVSLYTVDDLKTTLYQTTVVNAHKMRYLCKGKPHHVLTGRQMVRQL